MSPDRSTHNPEQDAFDAMLDHTLRARAQAGPRAGFHHRLARSLQHQEECGAGRLWWWRPLTLTLGVATVVAAVVVGPGLLHHPPATKTPPRADLTGNAPLPSRPAAGDRAAEDRAEVVSLAKRRDIARSPRTMLLHARLESGRPRGEAVAEALPKLDTFPSATTHVDRPFGSSEPQAPMSAEAARAMLDLQRQQARPIVLTAINLNAPLFGE